MKVTSRLALVAMAFAGMAEAAAPKSVVDLYNQVLPPPATVDAVRGWVTDGKLSYAPALAVKRTLDAEKDAAARFGAEGGAKIAAATAKSAGASGIDMSRMQDPAYQAEVQARIARMSPQEQMALAQQMSQATQQDGLATVQDAPEMLAIVDLQNAYVADTFQNQSLMPFQQRQMELVRRWEERQTKLTKKLRYCDVGCTDHAGTEANNRAAWQEKLALLNQELPEWQALFRDWKAARAARVAEAQSTFVAAGFGLNSKSQSNRSTLGQYRAAMIGEAENLYELTRAAVERAGSFIRGADKNAAAGVAY